MKKSQISKPSASTTDLNNPTIYPIFRMINSISPINTIIFNKSSDFPLSILIISFLKLFYIYVFLDCPLIKFNVKSNLNTSILYINSFVIYDYLIIFIDTFGGIKNYIKINQDFFCSNVKDNIKCVHTIQPTTNLFLILLRKSLSIVRSECVFFPNIPNSRLFL